MKKTNIHEAKSNLSKLLELAESGEEVIICRAGKPVAKLIRFDKELTPRTPGDWKNKIKAEDDFDKLPKDFMRYFK